MRVAYIPEELRFVEVPDAEDMAQLDAALGRCGALVAEGMSARMAIHHATQGLSAPLPAMVQDRFLEDNPLVPW